MFLHSQQRYSIYFGDASDCLYSDQYLQWGHDELHSHPTVVAAAHMLSSNSVFFLHQVHGSTGIAITKHDVHILRPFSIEGDFLITNEVGLGIGVMTADCLPVVCYDQGRHVAGIAHAGWRGAVDGVVIAMLEAMCQQFHTKLDDIVIFFGPSAKRCCYQVSEEFEKNVAAVFSSTCFSRDLDKKLYFDMSDLIRQQLYMSGIGEQHIRTEYNLCTICDKRFCSYRRAMRDCLQQPFGRQMTIIGLR